MRRRRAPSAAPDGGGALEAEGQGGLELGQQVDELLAHERQVDEQPALGLAVVGPDRRLEEAAAGDAEAHHGHAEARAVDHLHHAVEPAGVGLAESRRRRPCARSA